MTWENPPDKIVEARDAIVACAAATTLGCGSTDAYKYPLGALKTDPIPFCVLEEGDYAAECHAPGDSYARGRILATFCLSPEIISMGSAEQAARNLVHQLAVTTRYALFITAA